MKSKSLRAVAFLSLLSGETLLAQAVKEEPFSIMLGGSMTGAGDMEYKGQASGEVETLRYQVEGSYEVPIGDDWVFQIGGEYERVEADHDMTRSAVPENLTKMAVTLGGYWKIDDRWAASVSVAPGFYGDDEVDFSDAFNAPFRILGHWNRSEDLSVIFGLRVNPFSDSTVMPILGVEWEINSQWELSLGVPRTELRYQWDENLSFFGGAELIGGSYAVDDDSMVSPNGRSLRDTYVSESEIRGLVGVDYQFDSGLKLRVEGGYAFERSLDYHERDVELEVDPALFGGVSLSFSF